MTVDISGLSFRQQASAKAVVNKCIRSRRYFIQEVLGASLEEWQGEVVDALDEGVVKISIRSGHGVGKCLENSTRLPSLGGGVLMGDIKVGEQIFGSNGHPTTVIGVYPQGERMMYKITFDDGSISYADPDHLWDVRGWKHRRKGLSYYETMTTSDILNEGVKHANGGADARQWEIPRQHAAQYPPQTLIVDPYVLGVWLGDGASEGGTITNGDDQIWEWLEEHYVLQGDTYPKETARTHTLTELRADLRVVEVLGNKHIPQQYMIGDVQQRTLLLQGLMDSDGWVDGAGQTAAMFGSIREALADQVMELARSLGMKARKQAMKETWYNDENGDRVFCKDFYKVSITSDGRISPFRLTRKDVQLRVPTEERYLVRWIDSIEYSHTAEATCIQVDADDSLYLTEHYVVTHNTCLCAWLALHFLCFRDDVKVIVTAPSADQMKDGLLPEVNKWISRLPTWMSASLEATTERVVRRPNASNNFMSFRTARKEKPEALAGVHATHVMILVDEASGVDEAIYETGQGALSTSGAIAILIGNPTNPSGFFYKTQTSLSDIWWTKKVSCEDSTQVDENYIITQARTYGVDSREYRVRVLGEFPESGADAVIPRSFVQSALDREVSGIPGDIVWGVDPGRGGDPTGFVERSTNELTEYRELRYVDLMSIVGWVHRRYMDIPPRYQPKAIYVDSIGLGAGVADRMLELGLPVIHVNVSEVPAMRERFTNLRAEIWYEVRGWLESKDVRIEPSPMFEKLIGELVEVRQKFTSLGKVQLESKLEMKKRGVSSPNMADALALTFAGGGAVGVGNYEDSWGSVDMSKYKVPGIV